MDQLKESIKKSINYRLQELEKEENRLKSFYEGRLRVANDGYYAGIARSKARSEANKAQELIDGVINRKLELLKELQSL